MKDLTHDERQCPNGSDLRKGGHTSITRETRGPTSWSCHSGAKHTRCQGAPVTLESACQHFPP